MPEKVVIGGAAGMWGDSMLSTRQLLGTGRLDYLIYECLAEITMAIMSRARLKNPDLGYATDVIETLLPRHLEEIARQGVKVVTNAGGVNPRAAAAALRKAAQERGLDLKIGTVEGDDAMPHLATLREAGVREMDRGTEVPLEPISANAYLGARPVAAALGAGADIVITGRCVDSALALGPLIHEFGWAPDRFDQLAQGSLAGHLIECGPQSTGGLMTDWEASGSWVDIGFPMVECEADGAFTLTKPDGTDGIVSRASAAEQVLYEIGDPAAYVLPDVVCDFTQVGLEETGPDRVRVTGARGLAPPPRLKVCAQEADGWRVQFLAFIGGRDAALRARRAGEEMVERMRRVFRSTNLGDFRDVSVEVLGAEDTYGPHGRAGAVREVMLKIAVAHDERPALELFAREAPSMGLAMAQGTSGGGAGRARPSPLIRLHSLLAPRGLFEARVEVESEPVAFEDVPEALCKEPPAARPDTAAVNLPEGETVTLPLIAIAFARSGDKGDRANVGVAARHPDFLPLIAGQVTADAVKTWLGHLVSGPVERFALPGFDAVNFLMRDALGGGGTASLRFDPQGKAMGQMLLDFPIELPRQLLEHPALKPVPEVLDARSAGNE